ncbi:LapB repeat-containing protein [Listeria marthii]|uniref:LapB repeat-containing protein n=1 Tax=Listeria marthii TaxID=529731 RepID=UPI001629DA55|nr:LapB repeat-containing protein [Listeria marthii]MBC1997173.1 LapB repeat-containing protein [Listeria marthii]MBC2001413.1 LapB repeat-containing protein [Listeria marthii]MBC2073644.1 LapB repeat-containing protein [Listeria marthii]MBF2399406.1 LapB repeat-containing protein [Listeria marthii]MBF2675480.1 LapB repeat-containing protein [Listeria marthii]
MSIKSKIMKIGVCSVMVLVPLSQTSFPGFAAEEIGTDTGQGAINIPDSVLKATLNSNLGQASTADITEAQMSSLNGLNLSGNITDLTGLEYAKNLNMLTISDISAGSYAPIAQLTNLEHLTITGSNVTSNAIPDLTSLTALKSLSITNASIDNSVYSKINNISSLASLNLKGNKNITNVTNLKSLPNLSTLVVEDCQIADYKGVEDFPRLTNFQGGKQAFESQAVTEIKSNTLNYDAKAQTMFIPYSLLTPSSLTNFDGSKINPSFKLYEYEVELSTGAVADSKMTATAEGITINGVTPADFDQIEDFSVYTLFDVRKATKPANLATGYGISNSSVKGKFTVDHSVSITAEDNISYIAGETVTPEKFLTDINANANGPTVTSDVAEKVDFTKAGTYTVTLNAENSTGVKSEPMQVTVTIIEKTAITADPEVTYELDEAKTEAEFLADIKAATNDETPITSDFATVVDFTKAGEYTVTLNAESDVQKANPLTVKVKINEKAVDPVKPTPDPTPDPDDPTTDPDNPEPTPTKGKASQSGSLTRKSTKSGASYSAQSTIKTVKLPKTGDSLPATGVVVGFLVLGLGVMIARKK